VKVGWLKDKPDKKYAIKTMKKQEIITSKHVDHIENEKKILELLTHPFVVSSINFNLATSACIRWFLSGQPLHILSDGTAWRRRFIWVPQKCG